MIMKWLILKNCLAPVSYTHLDVYKRQTLVDISFCDNKYSEHDVTETIANLKELQSRLNDSEQSKNAVSYTHLDVYKRQYSGCFKNKSP